MDELITCENHRRFGVEIEINSFNGVSRPPKGEMPKGIEYVGNLVAKISKDPVEIRTWQHTHNNDVWVIKPDSSCGIEVCSPIVKGWHGLKKILKVIEAFQQDKKIKSDDRCAFHLHVNMIDINDQDLGTILAYWIKCEPVFMDAAVPKRKRNRYCQQIGVSNVFDHEDILNYKSIIGELAKTKYYTVNTFHYMGKGKRKTIEFRLMENDCCVDPFAAKNWIRLLMHFVAMTRYMKMPSFYIPRDPWSSLLWLDPKDVFSLLDFDKQNLSDGLLQTRTWFLERLLKNTSRVNLPGVWSKEGRSVSRKQILELSKEIDVSFDISEDLLYGERFKI